MVNVQETQQEEAVLEEFSIEVDRERLTTKGEWRLKRRVTLLATTLLLLFGVQEDLLYDQTVFLSPSLPQIVQTLLLAVVFTLFVLTILSETTFVIGYTKLLSLNTGTASITYRLTLGESYTYISPLLYVRALVMPNNLIGYMEISKIDNKASLKISSEVKFIPTITLPVHLSKQQEQNLVLFCKAKGIKWIASH